MRTDKLNKDSKDSKECTQCNKPIVGAPIFSEADTGPYCSGCWDKNLRSAGNVIMRALFGDEACDEDVVEYGGKHLTDMTEDEDK